jgi:hypothetical protein
MRPLRTLVLASAAITVAAPAAVSLGCGHAQRPAVASEAGPRGGGPHAAREVAGSPSSPTPPPPMSIEALDGDAPITPRFRPRVIPVPRGRLGPATAPSDLPTPEERDEDDVEERGLPPAAPSASARPGDE